MGRTRRCRLRRNSSVNKVTSLGQDGEFQQLVQWMKCNGWVASGRLVPAHFPTTGRGLQTLQCIPAGEVLVNIPGKLLMTVETASKSVFGWLFKRRTMLSQQVLSAHLALESHLGEQSFWDKYISSLPSKIVTPVFTSSEEVNALPIELSDKVDKFKNNIKELFKDFVESFTAADTCPHCDQRIERIFSIDIFLWAWFVINSRAVYICPERNSDHDLLLSDSNCLALAPYLDMFNHSNNAKVQAFVSDVDGSYQIKTLTPHKKFSQIFIHYGDHSNKKLYLEYGFIIPRNIHDIISLTFDDIYSTVLEVHLKTNVTKATYNFLKSHDLLTNIYLNADGLSWSARALIYVLLSSGNIDPKTIQLKVFSNNFSDIEISEIMEVGKVLVKKKQAQIENCILEMEAFKLSKNVSESFVMAIDLYKEYVNVLCDCDISLSSNKLQ